MRYFETCYCNSAICWCFVLLFLFFHFTISSLKTPLLQLISDLVVDLLSLNSLYTQLSFYIIYAVHHSDFNDLMGSLLEKHKNWLLLLGINPSQQCNICVNSSSYLGWLVACLRISTGAKEAWSLRKGHNEVCAKYKTPTPMGTTWEMLCYTARRWRVAIGDEDGDSVSKKGAVIMTTGKGDGIRGWLCI